MLADLEKAARTKEKLGDRLVNPKTEKEAFYIHISFMKPVACNETGFWNEIHKNNSETVRIVNESMLTHILNGGIDTVLVLEVGRVKQFAAEIATTTQDYKN